MNGAIYSGLRVLPAVFLRSVGRSVGDYNGYTELQHENRNHIIQKPRHPFTDVIIIKGA